MNETPDLPGRLKLRHVAVDTYHENAAYMHGECETCRAEGFQALSKIRISADGRGILAMLNVVRDASLVAPDAPWPGSQPSSMAQGVQSRPTSTSRGT